MIDVVDQTKSAAADCGADLDALIKAWVDRGARTRDAIAALIAGAVVVARRQNVTQESLIGALLACWEGGDSD